MSFLSKVVVTLTGIAVLMITTGPVYGQINSGETAPLFALEDVNGKRHNLAAMKSQPMIILYFFDVESRPSQEGLFSLDQLTQQYKGSDLLVWGITRSPKKKVTAFIDRTKTRFPVLLDTSNVSEIYQAQIILPTICILGPELKVLDYIQGGGQKFRDHAVAAGREKFAAQEI